MDDGQVPGYRELDSALVFLVCFLDFLWNRKISPRLLAYRVVSRDANLKLRTAPELLDGDSD
jgi:hypothetical protein